MDQINNCPFCHACSVERPVILDEVHLICGDLPPITYHCRCTYCNASGPIKGTKRAAIRAWNRRDMSNGKNQTARNRC